MKASEARAIAASVELNVNQEQYDLIKTRISEEANNGEYYLWVDFELDKSVRKALQDEDYYVKEEYYDKDETDNKLDKKDIKTKISW